MDNSEMFWSADFKELKKGYAEEEEKFICLLCGKEISKGIVYPEDEILYEPEKYMQVHIAKSHISVFDYLINMDKKFTGLTEHQTKLIKLFYSGKSDSQIQKEMDISGSSTIRNHRFVLKEKERQSKIFIALMDLLKEKDKNAPSFVEVPKTAKMLDERYNVTVEEKENILKKYFPDGRDGFLKTFVLKEKQKFVVLGEIIKRFEAQKIYTEKEVNEIIKTAYFDYVTVRRFLIEYGFLDRKPNGSEYWLK
ncbi:MAG: DUF2087 domain-containing protein [Actinomycetota bacterium]